MFENIKTFTGEQIEARKAEIMNEIDTADQTKLDSLNSELDALEERRKELELEQRKANMKAVAGGAGIVIGREIEPEKRSLKSVLASDEYVDAFAEFIKTGDEKECRALLTDLVDGGSVPTPTVIDDFIATAWESNEILRRVRRTNIRGTAKYPFEYSATGASVHTEGAAAPSEETLVLGTVSVEPQMLKKWITVSDEILSLKGQAFLDYLYDEIEQRILELAITQIITAIKAAPESATKSAAGVRTITGAFDAYTIFAAQAELVASAVNPVAIMNKKTYFNTFMALHDTTGRPIYNVVSENGRPTYFINGIEVLFINDLAENEIIVGDLNGVIMNLPDDTEVRFTTDPYSLSEKDLVKIVGKMYAGIGVVRDGYFCYASTGVSA